MVSKDRLREAMGRALFLANRAREGGDVPVGAVVLDSEGRVVGEGWNQRERDHDPSAHAEIVALRAAGRRLGRWNLVGCTLVVTLEPCTMCAGAAVQARVDRVVFAAWDPKAGAAGSVRDVLRDSRLNHRVEVVGGVLAEEANIQLRGFFESRRGAETPRTPAARPSGDQRSAPRPWERDQAGPIGVAPLVIPSSPLTRATPRRSAAIGTPATGPAAPTDLTGRTASTGVRPGSAATGTASRSVGPAPVPSGTAPFPPGSRRDRAVRGTTSRPAVGEPTPGRPEPRAKAPTVPGGVPPRPAQSAQRQGPTTARTSDDREQPGARSDRTARASGTAPVPGPAPSSGTTTTPAGQERPPSGLPEVQVRRRRRGDARH